MAADRPIAAHSVGLQVGANIAILVVGGMVIHSLIYALYLNVHGGPVVQDFIALMILRLFTGGAFLTLVAILYTMVGVGLRKTSYGSQRIVALLVAWAICEGGLVLGFFLVPAWHNFSGPHGADHQVLTLAAYAVATMHGLVAPFGNLRILQFFNPRTRGW